MNNMRIVYIDEFSMKTNIVSNYGYTKYGEKNRVIQPNCNKNISGIAAISYNGIIGFTFKEGSIDSYDYKSFLIMLLNENDEIKNNLNQYIFYTDGCATHKSKILEELRDPLNLFIGPPYTP